MRLWRSRIHKVNRVEILRCSNRLHVELRDAATGQLISELRVRPETESNSMHQLPSSLTKIAKTLVNPAFEESFANLESGLRPLSSSYSQTKCIFTSTGDRFESTVVKSELEAMVRRFANAAWAIDAGWGNCK